MSRRNPISIHATYTDSNGQLVEKQFRSLSQASNFFSITPQMLKELSLGGTPQLHDDVPKDLKVERIDTLPKLAKEIEPVENNTESKWHCEICNKDIKSKSKYAHVMTLSHKKNLAMIAKQKHSESQTTDI